MKQFLFFLLTLPVFGQTEIKGIVVDESHNAIPYVTIIAQNQNTIANSETDGSFKILLRQDSNIVFSAVGYETRTVRPNEAEKVVLKKLIFELKEVVVKPIKKQTHVIGKSKGAVRYFHGNELVGKAFRFSEEMKNYPFLKSIRFYSMNDLDSVKVNVMVKQINPDGTPGNDLLENNVIISIKKGSTYTTVNLEKLAVEIPENGIFVSVQGIMIEESKFCRTYLKDFPDQQSKNETHCSYQPHFGFLPSGENSTWFYENGKWRQHALNKIENPKSFSNILMKKYHEKYLDLPISLTLTN